jgi:hypothetical protein
LRFSVIAKCAVNIKEDPALDVAGAAQTSHVRAMVARRQRAVKIPFGYFEFAEILTVRRYNRAFLQALFASIVGFRTKSCCAAICRRFPARYSFFSWYSSH